MTSKHERSLKDRERSQRTQPGPRIKPPALPQRPARRLAPPPVPPTSRAAFGHIVDAATLAVEVRCPWCAAQHSYQPDGATHQLCTDGTSKLVVLIPLAELERLT